MEKAAFAPKEQMLHFHNIFKYMIFRRRHKALLGSKGLKILEIFEWALLKITYFG